VSEGRSLTVATSRLGQRNHENVPRCNPWSTQQERVKPLKSGALQQMAANEGFKLNRKQNTCTVFQQKYPKSYPFSDVAGRNWKYPDHCPNKARLWQVKGIPPISQPVRLSR
jgi:hypothetical protein